MGHSGRMAGNSGSGLLSGITGGEVRTGHSAFAPPLRDRPRRHRPAQSRTRLSTSIHKYANVFSGAEQASTRVGDGPWLEGLWRNARRSRNAGWKPAAAWKGCPTSHSASVSWPEVLEGVQPRGHPGTL